MDYPKSTPGIGLVDGRFVDENQTTGQPGSLIPAAWANALMAELLGVIKAAGIVPSEEDNAQLLHAIQTMAASDYKKSVRCATTGPIALSGLQTIDDVLLVAGDRVLVKDQAAAAQNWIYTVSPNAWVRAQDANESAECAPGHLIPVQAGTVNKLTVWQLTNPETPVVGTTALTFRVVIGKQGATLADYGIGDAYTKAQTYSQAQVDALIGQINPVPTHYQAGFFTSMNAASPTTSVDIAAGVTRGSAGSPVVSNAVMSGVIQSAGGWAAGSGANKLDAGARAPNTWYHPFVMRRTSDGQADHLWSASLTAPTVPPGYDSATRLKGRSIKTDSAGNIVPFINTGNSTTFKSLQQDMFVTNVATTSYTLTVSVPPGVRVRARFYARTQGESSVIYVRSPEAAAAVLGNTATDAFVGGIGTSNDATSNENVSGYCESLTNQSAQVVAQVFGYVGYNVLRASLHTIGWTED